MTQTLKEFLMEKRLISRGVLVIAALVGGFAGAVLMLFFAMLGIVG